MTPKRLAILLPAIFAIHNGEEALTLPRFLPQIHAHLPAVVLAWNRHIEELPYLLALLILTTLSAGIGLWVLLRPASHPARWVLLLLQAVLLLNVFSHLAFTVLLHGYAPGLVSALLLNLPLSLYVFWVARRDRWISRPALYALIPSALIAHGPLLLGFLWLVVGRGA